MFVDYFEKITRLNYKIEMDDWNNMQNNILLEKIIFWINVFNLT